MFVHIFKFIVVYMMIKLVFSEFIGPEQQSSEYTDEEASVLDSVYDTLKHNYEMKMRLNLNKLKFISEIRNKRNINEPAEPNIAEYYNNHQYEVNRRDPVSFPIGFKSPPRVPITRPMNPAQSRADYGGYEE